MMGELGEEIAMKFDRKFWRRIASWVAIGAVVYFGNVEFQSWLGRRALASMDMTIYSLDEGLAAATSDRKLIVADMSAIWCSSCRTFDQKDVAMSLNLMFLLLGAVLLAGGTVSFRGSTAISIRTISAAALATGYLMFLIGLINALSGTT